MLADLGWIIGLIVSTAFFPLVYVFGTSRIATLDEARAWVAILAYLCLILLLSLLLGVC